MKKTYLWFDTVFMCGTVLGAQASSRDEALERIKACYGERHYDACKEQDPIVLSSPLGTIQYAKIKKKPGPKVKNK